MIAVVGITDEVDRAAGLAEEGQPNNSTVDLCPDRCFGECLRKSALALCSRPLRTRIHSHFHRCVTLLRLADLVLTTDSGHGRRTTIGRPAASARTLWCYGAVSTYMRRTQKASYCFTPENTRYIERPSDEIHLEGKR